jgi:hypothetical protein
MPHGSCYLWKPEIVWLHRHLRLADSTDLPVYDFNGQREVIVNKPDSLVFLVDNDAAVREAIQSLIRSAGLYVEGFASVL